jgi:hypothetical protein
MLTVQLLTFTNSNSFTYIADMSLAKECYSMNLQLLMNATSIDGAMGRKSVLFYLWFLLLHYSSATALHNIWLNNIIIVVVLPFLVLNKYVSALFRMRKQ